MKNGLKAVGKAIGYYVVYLLMQTVVSVVYSAVLSAKLTMELGNSSETLDMALLTESLTEALMERLMEMTLVAGIATLLLFWLVFAIRRKKFTEEVCLKCIPKSGILPIVIMAASFNIITTVVVSCIPWPQSWLESYVANSSTIDGSVMAWLAAVFSAPILEEVVFRGLMYTRLKKGLPMIAAAILTSLAFGIAHGTIIWAIYTFLFSMVLIWVFEKFQSLTACILLHMSYNLSGMVLSLLPEDGAVFIWLLFAAGIVAAYAAYRKIEEIAEENRLGF